jgi:putative ABC transport system permease protein
MAEGGQASQIFVPSRSPGWPRTAIVAKIAGRPEDPLAMIRAAIQSVDPEAPLFDLKTMEQRMSDEFARPQFHRTAVMCFSGFALVLAVLGIYGLVSYSVSRRKHELGIRMALGATPMKLRTILVLAGLIPVVAGAIPGVAGAALSGMAIENLVEGAKPVSAMGYGAAIFLIASVAVAGAWVATRPVARLNVIEVLRSE